MYYLLNKDRLVAEFDIHKDILGDIYKLNIIQQDGMPIGFENIQKWIDNRKGSKHNAHLKKIMSMCGCDTTEGFIAVTHSATINDTFWIKSDKENINWKDVSLYTNEFNQVVSRLAFEGVGLYCIELSSTIPELSTEGSFRKCWRKEAEGIFLYKRGQDGGFNAGLEPYCEVMASELAAKLCGDSVKYDLVKLYGELATRCRLFTNENEGYVPAANYHIEKNLRELIRFYEQIGSEEAFRRMIVLDGITFNVDRHAGNYGILIDNDTLEPLKMAPVFDFNLSMLPYVLKDEFEDIGTKLLEYGPRIGDDFVRTAHAMLTPSIRADLVALKGFQFSFRGDEVFPEERVEKMEELINRQIEGILDNNVLMTRDVFIPHIPEQHTISKKVADDRQESKIAEAVKVIEDIQSVESSYTECDENGDLILHIIIKGMHDVEILFNAAQEELTIEKEGNMIVDVADCHIEDVYRKVQQAIIR